MSNIIFFSHSNEHVMQFILRSQGPDASFAKSVILEGLTDLAKLGLVKIEGDPPQPAPRYEEEDGGGGWRLKEAIHTYTTTRLMAYCRFTLTDKETGEQLAKYETFELTLTPEQQASIHDASTFKRITHELDMHTCLSTLYQDNTIYTVTSVTNTVFRRLMTMKLEDASEPETG